MVSELAKALTEVGTAAVMEDFLRAILTPRELEKVALRWRLVILLLEGHSQRHIAHELGISLCKITRGSHELKYGPAGFREAVRRVALRHRGSAGRTRARKRSGHA